MKVQDDADKFKQQFGVDSIFLDDLNQENAQVKRLANEYEDVVFYNESLSTEQRSSPIEDMMPSMQQTKKFLLD